MWQDYVLAGTQAILTAAIVPMVFQKGKKPPFTTSIPTSIGLAVIAFTVSTLGLWWSAGVAALASFLWFILVAQRMGSSY